MVLNRKTIWLVLGVGVIALTSFLIFNKEQPSLHSNQYLIWMEDTGNGLRKSKELGAFDFALQYKPAEYTFLKEQGRNSWEQSELEELDQMHNFTFRITTANKYSSVLKTKTTSNQAYYNRIAYFSYDLQNDFYLLDGVDTLPCKLYQWVRNYELSPHTDLMLSFDAKQNVKDDLRLVYDDKILGVGPVWFTIDKNDIQRIPNIQL